MNYPQFLAVCHIWRDEALSYGKLWAYIDIYDYDEADDEEPEDLEFAQFMLWSSLVEVGHRCSALSADRLEAHMTRPQHSPLSINIMLGAIEPTHSQGFRRVWSIIQPHLKRAFEFKLSLPATLQHIVFPLSSDLRNADVLSLDLLPNPPLLQYSKNAFHGPCRPIVCGPSPSPWIT